MKISVFEWLTTLHYCKMTESTQGFDLALSFHEQAGQLRGTKTLTITFPILPEINELAM